MGEEIIELFKLEKINFYVHLLSNCLHNFSTNKDTAYLALVNNLIRLNLVTNSFLCDFSTISKVIAVKKEFTFSI